MENDRDIVKLEKRENGVAILTLNTPPLNLMTIESNERLDERLKALAQDDGITAVILTGAGEKCFSAGADIREFAEFVHKGTMVSEKLVGECAVLNHLAELPQPTIAALNGAALGGGIEMALCCDYRIMGEEVKIGFPEIEIGLFPGSGGLVRLPKLIGTAKAKELMLFGKQISAREALALNIANEVCPNHQVLERAMERADRLAQLPGESLRAVKRGIEDVYEIPVRQGIEYSLGLISRVLASEDAREGVNAFLEKRKPVFNRRKDGEDHGK